MNIEKIELGTFPFNGVRAGTPCVKISVSDSGEEMTQDEIVQEIRSSGMKCVAFNVNIEENPEIKILAEGLV